MEKRFMVPGVGPLTPLNAAAPAVLLAKAKPLFELEEAARGGADMDAVHDMRVASRRLREAMRLLGPLYPEREFRRWYRRIRRITRALGPVRDSDVFIDEFSRLGERLAEPGRRAVVFMVGHRMGQRVSELEALNRELAHLDLERNRRAFKRFAEALDPGAAAGSPFSEFAHAAVAERAASVFRAQPAALEEERIAEQHALRIDYKRLRYAVEAFALCYGDAFDALHGTLTSFQDALGDLHDAHIFLDMLKDPERVTAAVRAGVSEDGLAEVVSVLEERAHAEYERFTTLVREHPAERLLPALLLPLAAPPPQPASEGEAHSGTDAAPQVVETAESPAVSEFAIDADGGVHTIPPVVVGDKPWETGWEQRPVELAPGPEERVLSD